MIVFLSSHDAETLRSILGEMRMLRVAVAQLRDPLERIAVATESQVPPPAVQSIAWHHAEPTQEV